MINEKGKCPRSATAKHVQPRCGSNQQNFYMNNKYEKCKRRPMMMMIKWWRNEAEKVGKCYATCIRIFSIETLSNIYAKAQSNLLRVYLYFVYIHLAIRYSLKPNTKIQVRANKSYHYIIINFYFPLSSGFVHKISKLRWGQQNNFNQIYIKLSQFNKQRFEL